VDQIDGSQYEAFHGKVRAYVATPSAKGSTAINGLSRSGNAAAS
jgi:hypothetical protein